MHEGNWTCSGCGGEIKELPFEPKNTENLLCRDCHAKRRGAQGGGRGERKLYEGDWTCADCGGKISQLPFEPRETGNLRCVDCFKKSKEAA